MAAMLAVSDVEVSETLKRVKIVAETFGYCIPDNVDIVEAHDRVMQDVVSCLKKAETNRRLWYRQSPQINLRRSMVSFIMRLCSMERLSEETTYHAIYLMDRFMDSHNIIPGQLQPTSLTCVAVACKFHEEDSEKTTFKQLSRYMRGYATKLERLRVMVELEQYILHAFNFRIMVPLEIHFLEIFMMYALDGKLLANRLGENNNYQEPEVSTEQVVLELKSIDNCREEDDIIIDVHETANLILQELARNEPDTNFAPSLIAASIMMAARRENQLNFWTPALAEITTYSIEVVSHCLAAYIEPQVKHIKFTQEFHPPVFWNIQPLRICFI